MGIVDWSTQAVIAVMSDGPAAKKARTQEPGTLGEDAICFRIASPTLSELDVDETFRPLMTHQLLGEEEMIYGYKEPKLTVNINLATYEVSINFKHNGQTGKCTEVTSLMANTFKGAVLGSTQDVMNSSSERLREDPECLGEEAGPCLAAIETSIHRSALKSASPKLKDVHKRAQLLLPFFIDGAESIDQEDDNWELFTAVTTISGQCCLVGFCTAYRIYAYPDSHRLRVSQLFVLPIFQGQGVGKALLKAVYWLAEKEELQDIVYEDPTEDVETMRDKIEAERCEGCEWLTKLAAEQQQSLAEMNGHAEEAPLKGVALSGENIKRAQKELRLTKQQVQKGWEVLLAKQPGFQEEPRASILRGLIAKRLLGKFSDTEHQAVGKQILKLENSWGESFIMRKVPFTEGLKGMPVALDDKKEKGQSKEEREKAWEEAIEARWQAIIKLVNPAMS